MVVLGLNKVVGTKQMHRKFLVGCFFVNIIVTYLEAVKNAAQRFKRNTLCHGVPFVHALTVVEKFVHRALVKTKAAKNLYSRKII